MHKRALSLAALLLALTLLCGCADASSLLSALQESVQEQQESEEMPHFTQMVYERPVLDALRGRLDELEQALDEGQDYRRLEPLLDRCYEDYYHYLTMYNLAYIRTCQDLRDAYYAEEYAWCDANMARLSQLMEEMLFACGASPLAQELEERYFWPGFADSYGDEADAQYDEALVALLQAESELLSRYRAITAGAYVEEGGELDELETAEGVDGEALSFYESHNESLGGLYIELVRLRGRIAEKLGFSSYEEMAYLYDYERDYSADEAAAYLEQIKTLLVPLYRELGTLADYADASPLSTQRLRRALAESAQSMGGQIAEAFAFMEDYGLCDLEVSPCKAETSFEIYLHDYEAPFLFLDAWGSLGDLLNGAHEFGHYVDAYVNYNASETVDVSESFSQAMEYLLLCRLGEELSAGEQAELRRLKLCDTLDLYVQQGAFAEFEHRVYAMAEEELTLEALNALSLELAERYGYYDGVSADYYAKSWIGVAHFFTAPFYIIAYPVSNDVAMQLYALEQREPGAGLEKYLELLPREHAGLIDSVEACGLESPFAPGRIERVAEALRAGLKEAQLAA